MRVGRERQVISALNSACATQRDGGVLRGSHWAQWAPLLDVFQREGFVRGYEPILEGKDTKGIRFWIRSFEGQTAFSHVVSTGSRPWDVSWNEIAKRHAMAPVRPFRTGAEKKQKPAPAGEVWILKTAQGWLSEGEAYNRHIGGEVCFRIYTNNG